MSDLQHRIRDALEGRYEIVRELGSGGMAVVFLAKDVKHAREVALKVLRPEIAMSMGAERFASEILSVAQLSHPHILPLYDSGEADGFLYYVMPFVEGESLQDKLKREGPLPEDEAVRIAFEVAQGLDYAHKRGLIHRDIKPANVMLSGGHALIADFGIARAVDQVADQGLTQTGTVVGTPVYMSPEQFGSGAEMDGRGDLYSLSCVTYEMLAGKPPFEGSSVFGLMASHTTGEIPSILEERPDVSETIDEVLARGLAKDPDDRFRTTGEFAIAITTGEGTLVGLPRPKRGTARAKPKWLVPAGAAATGLVAIAAAVAVLSPGGDGGDGSTGAAPPLPALERSRVVVASLENVSGLPAYEGLGDMGSDWITQGLHATGIVDVIPSPTARQASRFIAQGVEAGTVSDPVQAIAEETSAGIVISGRYYAVGDSLYFQLDITNAVTGELLDALGPIGGSPSSPLDAVQALRGQVMGSLAINLDERLEGTGGGTPPTFEAYRAFNRGLDAYIESDWQDALGSFHEAFDLDGSFPIPMLYAALSHSNLGQFVEADSALGMIADARSQLSDYHRYWVEHLEAMYDGDRDRAYEAIRRAADLSPNSKASYNAGWAAVFTRRPEAALGLFDRLDPDRGPMRGWVHLGRVRAESLHMLGRHEEELEVARGLREHFPDFVDPLRVEGTALAALGRIDDAVAVAEEALTLEPRMYTPGFAILGIAHELSWLGHQEESDSIVDKAIAWYEALPAEELAQPRVAQEYADALLRRDRTEEAEAVWRSLADRMPGRWQFELAPGVIAARAGDAARALEASERLAEIEDRHARGGNTRMRATIATYLGRDEEAIQLLRQSYDEGFFYAMHPEHHFLRLKGNPDFDALVNVIRPS